jgi:hypothetical protein
VRERYSEMDEDEEVRQAFKALDRGCHGFLCLADVKVGDFMYVCVCVCVCVFVFV